jgi:hypothetical protein
MPEINPLNMKRTFADLQQAEASAVYKPLPKPADDAQAADEKPQVGENKI